MKGFAVRLLIVSVSAVFVSSVFGEAEDPVTDNGYTQLFGVVKITNEADQVEFPISTPWAETVKLESSTQTNDVKLADFIANGLADGDELSVYNPENRQYTVFKYVAETGKWTGAKDADTAETPDADKTFIKPGYAVWYKRNGTGIVSLIGQVRDEVVAETEAGLNTLVVDPFRRDVDICQIVDVGRSDLRTGVAMHVGNVVYYWNEETANWVTITITVSGKKKVKVQTPHESILVGAGEPVWFDGQSGGFAVLDWSVGK